LPDFKIELERHAASVLAPEEQLLAAIRAMPIGLFGGSLGIFTGAAVGAIVQSVAISRSVKKAMLSWFPLAGRMVIGITERRILVWSRGGTMGGITRFVGEVPLGRLLGVTAEPVPGRSKLTFLLRDAQAVVVEADRRDEPERFAQITRHLASGGTLIPPADASSLPWANPEPPLEPSGLSERVQGSAAPPQPPPIPPPPPVAGWKPQPAAVTAPTLVATSTAVAEEQMKGCAKCDARSPAVAEFCWRCFTSFPGAAKPFSGYAGRRVANAPRESRFFGSAKVGASALVVVALAAAVLVLTNRSERSRIKMPVSIAGAHRIATPQAQQAESQIAQLAKRYGVSGKAGFYGIEDFPTFAVVGFDYHISEEESPQVIFQQFSDGVASANGASVDMDTLTNDNLAGTTYICARVRGSVPGSVCMWSETDVVGFVLAIRQGVKDAKALTTSVRIAIETSGATSDL
jgi:hypothetical protein